MITKVSQAKKFRELINYVMKSPGAYLLDSDGVLLKSIPYMILTFNVQSRMRSSLGNKVGHVSVSFSPNDKERMTDEFMTIIVHEYMKKMGITNTQFIIVRHTDRAHPHCHIVYNRVNNYGKAIIDSFNFYKSVIICKELTRKYKLYMPQGKENVNIERLQEPDKTKYEIRLAIKASLKQVHTWEQFKTFLEQKHIKINFRQSETSTKIMGIIFAKGKYFFKGSHIDKNFSYPKLNHFFLNGPSNCNS